MKKTTIDKMLEEFEEEKSPAYYIKEILRPLINLAEKAVIFINQIICKHSYVVYTDSPAGNCRVCYKCSKAIFTKRTEQQAKLNLLTSATHIKKEDFDRYPFSINTEIKIIGYWEKVIEVDFDLRTVNKKSYQIIEDIKN